jgi:hypothetical protein
MWSMICRAMQALQDCYGSRTITTRQGVYTPLDTARDIKAMLVDDQNIDQERVVIVTIRGTKFQSLSDWAVNKAANPISPLGFLDDADNACHADFLQVAKAMVEQITVQLQEHPPLPLRPSLLFPGHSAGDAVAAMLYSHMGSTSVQSDLITLASQFTSVNCITFDAPPLSQTPLKQRGTGVFLAFANEGDPVLRLRNAAYVKSLAKLMTASQPASLSNVAAPSKVVRRSRGNGVIRQAAVAPVLPWVELPLWPTPPTPLTNAGDAILLQDDGAGAVASEMS